MDCRSDSLLFSVEDIYDYEKDKYMATDGYVLFHEDVNSKALIDMENNKYADITHDWFTIGEDECDCDECCGCCECDNDDTELTEDTHGFTVSNSDENGYYSYSFYSTDKNLVAEMAKRFK